MLKKILKIAIIFSITFTIFSPQSIGLNINKLTITYNNLLNDNFDNLWKTSVSGSEVFSMNINRDNIPDFLTGKYAIDGANGEIIYIVEAGKIINIGDKKEIITYYPHSNENTHNSSICLIDFNNGNKIWEKEIDSCWVFCVSVGDILGDDNNEILVGVGDVAYRGNNYLYCLNSEDGSTIWKKLFEGYVRTTDIADVNADGNNEIIVGTEMYERTLYCLNGPDGNKIWMFSRGILGHIKCFDIDNINDDPYLEIVVHETSEGNPGAMCVSGKDGSLIWNWYCIPDAPTNSNFHCIIVDDLIKDLPGKEVIVGGFYGVYCLYGGDNLPNTINDRELWFSMYGGETWAGRVYSISTGDIDKDGDKDVIALTCCENSSRDCGKLLTICGQNGVRMSENEGFGTKLPGAKAILFKDLIKDASPEIIIKSNTFICALESKIQPTNYQPIKPILLNGNSTGDTKTELIFEIVSRDPEQERICYQIDWGDGCSDTTAHYDSNTPVEIKYKYDKPGNYQINITAIDEKTQCSEILKIPVSITKSKTKPLINLISTRLIDKFMFFQRLLKL